MNTEGPGQLRGQNPAKSLVGSALLLLSLAQSAIAQEVAGFVPGIEFQCGGATVAIDSEPKGFRSPEEAYVRTGKLVQARIVVTRGESRATFQSWKDIDFIGGRCVDDAKGNPRIVYQAYCGGSGCDGLSNWGIIDAVELREMLTPGDHNTERAREILGAKPPGIDRLISLFSGR